MARAVYDRKLEGVRDQVIIIIYTTGVAQGLRHYCFRPEIES
jgi:hypothetical protein